MRINQDWYVWYANKQRLVRLVCEQTKIGMFGMRINAGFVVNLISVEIAEA
jgi:hypothetical protein